jgi:hypothetical protein
VVVNTKHSYNYVIACWKDAGITQIYVSFTVYNATAVFMYLNSNRDDLQLCTRRKVNGVGVIHEDNILPFLLRLS